MERAAFLEELKVLMSNEDLLSVSREVNELSVRFEDYMIEEERKLQIAQMDAEEKGESKPEDLELMQLKETFKAELKEYRDKRKVLIDTKNAEEEGNLAKKNALIKRLRDVIQNEENIGAAFGSLKEIQESWKEIGDIPRQKRDEIQTEYSRLVEDFFYNINIYKQLKEHDLHRNTQMKNDVIAKLNDLSKLDNIKEIEHQLKALQNDWEDIGPVTNEEWEVMKDNYWKAVRLCYDKINVFYEERRSLLQENLAKKQELLQQTTDFVSKLPENLDAKAWEEHTGTMLKFQETWKTIGFGPKKENEEIWKEFRSQCDLFFGKKKEFYGGLQSEYDEIAEKKKKIIEQAEALKSSTDWKGTSNELVRLQKQWKSIGNAGQRNEQRLWKQFRVVCDEFFNNRQKHFEEADAEFEQNLAKKRALIAEIEAYKVSDNKRESLDQLKQFSTAFNEIGKVPMKVKDSIYEAYKKALDGHYSALKLEGEEKQKIMFQARMDTLAASPNSSTMFAREKADLRKKIDQLKGDIIQFENNLGFFAKSKGADALKLEVEKKVNRAKEEIEELKLKIKMIPNE